MNWKRVGIATGALSVFVLGVGFTAYVTGSFVSQADEITGFDFSSTGTTATGTEATGAITNANGSPVQTGSAANNTSGATGTTGTINTVDPVNITSRLGGNFATLEAILSIGVPRLLISLAGLVMMVMFFVNAIKFLFNAGNQSGVAEAKAGMLNTGIGFVIVIAAYMIVTLISNVYK